MDYISNEALAEQKVNDILEHYGVKGMEWGKHKLVEQTPSSTTAKKEEQAESGILDTYVLPKSVREALEKKVEELHEEALKGVDLKKDSKVLQIIDSIIDLIKEYRHKPISKWFTTHSSLEYDLVDNVLSHHGIEGQKWGVKHGPPYPLDSKTSKAIKKSGKVTINVKDLSDDDLKRIINRLQMEKQLKELTKEETKKAESWISRIGKRTLSTGENVIFKSLETTLTAKATKVLSEKFDVEVGTKKKKGKDSE